MLSRSSARSPSGPRLFRVRRSGRMCGWGRRPHSWHPSGPAPVDAPVIVAPPQPPALVAERAPVLGIAEAAAVVLEVGPHRARVRQAGARPQHVLVVGGEALDEPRRARAATGVAEVE